MLRSLGAETGRAPWAPGGAFGAPELPEDCERLVVVERGDAAAGAERPGRGPGARR